MYYPDELFDKACIDNINEYWEKWLSEFKEKIYPTFEKHKLSFQQAVVLYKTNHLYSAIDDLMGEITVEHDQDEDQEPWKRKPK